jgi:hypothetical protein
MNQNPDDGESDSQIIRTPPKSTPKPKLLDQVPARLWFPIGFVGFFFIVGGWNQLASTWLKMTGSPLPGSAHTLGLLLASLIFFCCLLLGFRVWWRDQTESRMLKKDARDWRDDLKKHSREIRFP